MTYPIIKEEINDLEERKVNLSDLVNLIYPVGSIYMSVNNLSPSVFLGGVWESIEDTFLLCAGSTYSAGSTGGEETHTLTQEETPVHTHTRGTMNITGSFSLKWNDNTAAGLVIPSDYGYGSFYASKNGMTFYSAGNTTSSTKEQHYNSFTFDASRSWTGETSSVGSSQSHNNMPPYLTVYCWKRTA